MKRSRFLMASLLAGILFGLTNSQAALPGQEQIDACAKTWTNRVDWENRAAFMRKEILSGAGLWPWPPQTPLNPVWRQKIVHDGYTVQPVAFESMPGFYCMADLYLSTGFSGKRPTIIRTHGHGNSGRYGAQTQCAAMARMGAAVLAISMVGYNDAKQYGVEHGIKDAHGNRIEPGPAVFSLQLLDLIRSVDFLATLPQVDTNSLHITGESGGGTQTFFLAAVDNRIKVSIPVVMVSASHTGCRCEKGPGEFVPQVSNHAEVAALHAPRPQLVVSDGKDWTKLVPQVEFPYIQRVYQLFGAGDRVENAHFADEGHDYGPSKRKAAYAFFKKEHILQGEPNENIAPDSDEALSVFNEKAPLPSTALKTPAEIEARLKSLLRNAQ